MFSQFLLLLRSCEVRPLWIGLASYTVGWDRNWCASFNAEENFL